nr:transcriptional regulator, LysR family [uncultured bacterium]
MNLTHLRYFYVLAKYEHYGKAAEELHITQPSLSKAIRCLEGELGTYLFEKDGRGVRLTRQGKRYLKFVSEGLTSLDRGLEQLQREQSLSEGYLDIGLISSVSYLEFPQWVHGFRQTEGKNLYLSLHTDTSTALVQDLRSGKYDLVFCTETEDQDVAFAHVLEQPLACVVPQGHPFALWPSVDIHELDGLSFVAHTPDSRMSKITSRLCQEAGIQLRSVSEAREDRTILGLVRQGLGLAIMTLSPEVHGDGFVAIPLTGTSYHRYVSMGWLKTVARSEMAECFRRYILSSTASVRGETDQER